MSNILLTHRLRSISQVILERFSNTGIDYKHLRFNICIALQQDSDDTLRTVERVRVYLFLSVGGNRGQLRNAYHASGSWKPMAWNETKKRPTGRSWGVLGLSQFPPPEGEKFSAGRENSDNVSSLLICWSEEFLSSTNLEYSIP